MSLRSLIIELSNIRDGSMSAAVSAARCLTNRRVFLEKHGMSPEKTALVRVTYDTHDYCRYGLVTKDHYGDGIVGPSTITADALFTRQQDMALLLPLADCVGVVLHDPVKKVMGLAHLGRHNLLQSGGSAVVKYMINEFGTNPSDVVVFISPAAGRQRYPLYDFDNSSLHDIAIEQLLSAGITRGALTVDDRDTTSDSTLFSHSEYLQGRQEIDGRHALVCMIRQ